MAGLRNHLIVVVSGGGSAALGLEWRPRSAAVPASVNPLRNFRRLICLACWIRMGTSLLEAGQYDTENASQWTLLPSPEQAQHLTPRLQRRGPHHHRPPTGPPSCKAPLSPRPLRALVRRSLGVLWACAAATIAQMRRH